MIGIKNKMSTSLIHLFFIVVVIWMNTVNDSASSYSRCHVECLDLQSKILLEHCYDCEELDLSNMSLDDLNFKFSASSSLIKLNLSHNRFQFPPNVPIFFNLTHLEILDLSNNRLTIILEETLNTSLLLREIYLQNNQLANMKLKMFDKFKHLSLVNLKGNSDLCFTCLPEVDCISQSDFLWIRKEDCFNDTCFYNDACETHATTISTTTTSITTSSTLTTTNIPTSTSPSTRSVSSTFGSTRIFSTEHTSNGDFWEDVPSKTADCSSKDLYYDGGSEVNVTCVMSCCLQEDELCRGDVNVSLQITHSFSDNSTPDFCHGDLVQCANCIPFYPALRMHTFGGFNGSNNRLSKLPCFSQWSGLKWIDLTDNNIRSLTTNLWFGFNASLELLILRNNDFHVTHPDIFLYLARLQYIDLRENPQLYDLTFLSHPKELRTVALQNVCRQKFHPSICSFCKENITFIADNSSECRNEFSCTSSNCTVHFDDVMFTSYPDWGCPIFFSTEGIGESTTIKTDFVQETIGYTISSHIGTVPLWLIAVTVFIIVVVAALCVLSRKLLMKNWRYRCLKILKFIMKNVN